jgi:hypothetical protein
MFSTGLPILYPLACIFYFVLYWVYKFLLLKYYVITNTFNHELPIFSTSYIVPAVYLHIIFGGLMISNSSLLPKGTEEERLVSSALDTGFEPDDD